MTTIKVGLVIIALMFSSLSIGAPQAVDLSIFRQPTLLAGNGRYKQAAEQYHRLSIQILASEAKLGTEKMWQYAGLAEVLATVCANIDNDAKAYEYWANSVRYLLTGGTDWQGMQQSLHQRNEQANTQLLTQMQTIDIAGGYDQTWEQDAAVLQVWQEKLNLFVFSGPRTGMTVSSSSIQSNALGQAPVIAIPAPAVPGQKKLNGLESNFSQSSSFVPSQQPAQTPSKPSANGGAKTQSANVNPPTSSVPHTNRHLIQESGANTESELSGAVIIATPISEFDYEQAEASQLGSTSSNVAGPNLDKVDTKAGMAHAETSNMPTQLHKANIGAETKQGVEAIQRRSFAPTPE
ncbi:hypothetical protein ACE1OE_05725 [Vibrio sp. E150_011]